MPRIISEEEGAELKRLYKEHVAAVNRAGVTFASKVADSLEFLEADNAAEAVHRRIRKILGVSNSDRKDDAQPSAEKSQ